MTPKQIKAKRLELRLSQAQLAKEIEGGHKGKCHVQTISQLERGVYKSNPSLIVKRIKEYFLRKELDL